MDLSPSFQASIPSEDLSDDAALKVCSRRDFRGRECPTLGGVLLVARLGRGAAGVVYLGINPRLEKEVAVKVISPVRLDQWQLARERFLREARLAASIRSPHLTEVFEIDEDPASGCNYIIMEYVRGCSAEAWVRGLEKRGEATREPAVLEVGLAVSLALAVAHRQGIVHRDVKPSNVLVPFDDLETPLTAQAKLTDLGLAKTELDDQGVTQSFAAVGTPGYMAPEQIKDAKRVGKAVDVFGVGATVYGLLAGKPPFLGTSAYDSFSRTLDGEYLPLDQVRPDVSERLVRIVHTCLSPDPGDRFPDAVAVAEALSSVAAADGGHGERSDGLSLFLNRSEQGRAVDRRPSIVLAQGAVDEFRDAVYRARREHDLGALRLLADEVRESAPCLRFVGRAAYSVEDWSTARLAWEQVLSAHPKDPESILTLGTVYERQGDLGASTQALSKLLDEAAAAPRDMAEAHAQVARNRKRQWVDDWQGLAGKQRGIAALRSPFLGHALEDYRLSFLEDQNHYYSGLNALALCTIMHDLADRFPRDWGRRFESRRDATSALEGLEERRTQMAGAVRQSLESARHRAERSGGGDVWIALGFAEHALLSAQAPDYVAASYEDALALCDEGGVSMPIHAARQQVELYASLGVRGSAADAALKVFDARSRAVDGTSSLGSPVILFAGQRIDDPDRPTPRFPSDRALSVKTQLYSAMAVFAKRVSLPLVGIGGAASGGDILFHEVCAELGIATEVLLATPVENYLRSSVAAAGAEWIARYRAIVNSRPVRVLSHSTDLPPWVGEGRYASIWDRANRWMLSHALARDPQARLLAVWNGDEGDAPGGTSDMVSLAREQGLAITVVEL